MPAAKGDIVEIINDKDAEWWLCRLRGKQGFIPSSFIERASSDREAYLKSGVRWPADACAVQCSAAERACCPPLAGDLMRWCSSTGRARRHTLSVPAPVHDPSWTGQAVETSR